MCLCSINKKSKIPDPQKVVFGWKVFKKTEYSGKLYGEYNHLGIAPYRILRWIKAERTVISVPDGIVPYFTYDSGFHAFLKKKDATSWKGIDGDDDGLVVTKVKLRGVHAIGSQQIGIADIKVVVADEMLILPQKR